MIRLLLGKSNKAYHECRKSAQDLINELDRAYTRHIVSIIKIEQELQRLTDIMSDMGSEQEVADGIKRPLE